MPSPQPQEEIAPSSDHTLAGPSQNGPRSIYSFWGNGAGPSNPPPPPPVQLPPKRKRKKAHEASSQAKLALNGSNGATSAVRKGEQGETEGVVSSTSKGKRRAIRSGGEEEEMKEMAKKAKQLEAEAKKAALKRARKSAENSVPGDQGKSNVDISFIGPPSSPALSLSIDPNNSQVTNLLPTKGKRGLTRPRRNTATQPSPEVLDLASSDPSAPPSPPVSISGRRNSRLPPHPMFSRTISSSSKGAVHDPIDVEETGRGKLPAGPKKIAFAADHKPAHPLFARVAAGEANESRATSVVSETAPSEATVATAKTNTTAKSGKTLSFFSLESNGQNVPGKLKNGWGRGIKEGEELLPLWPGGDFPGHSTEAGPSFMTTHTGKRRRLHPSLPSSPEDMKGLSDFVYTETPVDLGKTSNSPTRPAQNQIPFISRHDALSSIKGKTRSSNRETCCERYRPTRASEVLGNELEATYLRDWLRAESVGVEGGRRVMRKVKRIKPQIFDGWIVDDAGLSGDPPEQEEGEEYEEYFEPDLELGQRPDSYPGLETRHLTNTMLLTGPHGTGKSAAVYAAATELGWEVFEVYPGMGRRTGGNLMSWVGDVGKNHLVVKGGGKTEKQDVNAIKAFFGSSTGKSGIGVNGGTDFPGSQGSAVKPIDIDEEEDQAPVNGDDEPKTVVVENGTEKTVRQSLILIDEADILFAEENTFWPAVVALIAESRRPVILTCNDLSRIPIEQLPIQAILHFQPSPSYLAIPYLETIAVKEGIHDISIATDIFRLCTSHNSRNLDQPLPPNGNEPLPSFDLRQAIMQMQVDRKSKVYNISTPRLPDELTALFRLLDAASFADASVAPRDSARMDVVEVDRYEPTPDDELGIRPLEKGLVHDHRPTLAAFDRAGDISDMILYLAGGPLEDLFDLQTARTQYIRSLLPLLDPLIPLSAPLLPSPSLFIYTMPAVRSIIEADDILEADEAAAVARGEGRYNHKTGRPKRATVGGGEGYGRYIDPAPDALQAARDSKLVFEKDWIVKANVITSSHHTSTQVDTLLAHHCAFL